MIRRTFAAALMLGAITFPAARTVAAAPDASPEPVRVELDRSSVDVGAGRSFQFHTSITNLTDQPLTAVIASLNIVSTDGDVYVDPEDWSSDRTQYLDTLDPGATQALAWNVRAVTTGDLILYVAVTTRTGQATVVGSGPLHATVTATQTINAAGVLPVALGVPAALVICLGLAVRKRRQLA